MGRGRDRGRSAGEGPPRPGGLAGAASAGGGAAGATRALRPISAEAPPPGGGARPPPRRPPQQDARRAGGAGGVAHAVRVAGRGSRGGDLRSAGVVSPSSARPDPEGRPPSVLPGAPGPRGLHRGLPVRPDPPSPPPGTSRRSCAAGASPWFRARALGRREPPPGPACRLPGLVFRPGPRAAVRAAFRASPGLQGPGIALPAAHGPPRPGLGSASPPGPAPAGRGSPSAAGLEEHGGDESSRFSFPIWKMGCGSPLPRAPVKNRGGGMCVIKGQ